MDTKWKNRIIIITWLVLFTFGLSGLLTALENNHEYVKQSYFKTTYYEDNVSQLLDYINAYEISYQSKEDLKKSLTVTKDEIEEYRYRYGDLTEQVTSIEEQYRSRIDEAVANDKQSIADVYIKERNSKIEEITKNFESDEYTEDKVLKEKEKRIDEYAKQLETYRDDYEQSYKEAFVYYLKNTTTKEVYTNLPIDDKKSLNNYINKDNTLFLQEYPTKGQDYLRIQEHSLVPEYENLLELKPDSNSLYEGKIAVLKDANNSNFIIESYQDYNNKRVIFWVYTLTALLSLISSLIIGKKIKINSRIKSNKWSELYNKVPIDAALVLFVITCTITMILIDDAPYNYSFYLIDIVKNSIRLILFVGFTLLQGIYLYPRLKELPQDKEVWKRTWLGLFTNMIRGAFLNRTTGTQVFLILAIVFTFGVGTILIIVEPLFLFVYIPAFVLIGLPLFLLIIKKVGYFNHIIKNARALAKGDFEPDLKIKGKSVLARLAEDINLMKRGVKTSLNAQAKSERFKTELITNVSHDLRTPLTSIITYSELLKSPELAEDERSSYIEIIDRKSKRLKVLIDDLFEASKMASGNIELTKAKVDIVQLLQQSLAEYDQEIQSAHIQFRVANTEKALYAFVDGQKLWRVFDNLIGNIIKYSLEQTRAYINLKEENGRVILTFKNVSKYELSGDGEELFERFKRGDTSRHTEGSGLGLAIAKSIVDLHNGTLDIEVDGDLFKVTVVLEKMSAE